MNVAQHIIDEADIQYVLLQAVAETMATTAAYCASRDFTDPPHRLDASGLEESLAWNAARATQRIWDRLPAETHDAQAPISCAVIELVEWVEHVVRFEALGESECRVPLTWLPRGNHALGSRDVAAAVEERLDLLRYELADYGVLMVAPQMGELAA
jgi:hypothetical protein